MGRGAPSVYVGPHLIFGRQGLDTKRRRSSHRFSRSLKSGLRGEHDRGLTGLHMGLSGGQLGGIGTGGQAHLGGVAGDLLRRPVSPAPHPVRPQPCQFLSPQTRSGQDPCTGRSGLHRGDVGPGRAHRPWPESGLQLTVAQHDRHRAGCDAEQTGSEHVGRLDAKAKASSTAGTSFAASVMRSPITDPARRCCSWRWAPTG